MYINIPVGKRLDYISGARTSNAIAYLRQDGNYIGNSSADTTHGFASEQGSFEINKDMGILRFRYQFSSVPKNAKNNYTISAYFAGGEILLS